MLMIYDAEKLSREIKSKRRVELDITLREAAKSLGIGYATLSRIENKKKPDIETLAAICDWIGQPMNLFFQRNMKFVKEIESQNNKKGSTRKNTKK